MYYLFFWPWFSLCSPMWAVATWAECSRHNAQVGGEEQAGRGFIQPKCLSATSVSDTTAHAGFSPSSSRTTIWLPVDVTFVPFVECLTPWTMSSIDQLFSCVNLFPEAGRCLRAPRGHQRAATFHMRTNLTTLPTTVLQSFLLLKTGEYTLKHNIFFHWTVIYYD